MQPLKLARAVEKIKGHVLGDAPLLECIDDPLMTSILWCTLW